MLASGFRYLVRVAAGAVAGGLMFATLATAQTPTSTINQFLANPAQVLSQFPNGGPDLVSLIRDVATSHPEALQTITSLLANGNADQQAAIGSGLGQAYKIVINSDQNYATQIAAAIGNSSSSDAQTAFAGASGNVSTAATGAGGGGGGGGGSGGSTGGGGQQSGGSNSGTGGGGTGQSSSQTASTTFTGGGGGVGVAGSVSPR